MFTPMFATDKIKLIAGKVKKQLKKFMSAGEYDGPMLVLFDDVTKMTSHRGWGFKANKAFDEDKGTYVVKSIDIIPLYSLRMNVSYMRRDEPLLGEVVPTVDSKLFDDIRGWEIVAKEIEVTRHFQAEWVMVREHDGNLAVYGALGSMQVRISRNKLAA